MKYYVIVYRSPVGFPPYMVYSEQEYTPDLVPASMTAVWSVQAGNTQEAIARIIEAASGIESTARLIRGGKKAFTLNLRQRHLAYACISLSSVSKINESFGIPLRRNRLRVNNQDMAWFSELEKEDLERQLSDLKFQ